MIGVLDCPTTVKLQYTGNVHTLKWTSNISMCYGDMLLQQYYSDIVKFIFKLRIHDDRYNFLFSVMLNSYASFAKTVIFWQLEKTLPCRPGMNDSPSSVVGHYCYYFNCAMCGMHIHI